MTRRARLAAKMWWIIQKDLVSECRAQLVWPRMLLLGLVVACLFNYQIHTSPGLVQQIAPSLCWLTICFAAILSLGQSITTEREDACWEALLLYPVTPQTVYFAKLIGNGITLGALQCVVIPIFAVFSGAQWLARPGEIMLVAVLGNLGVVSIGTLVGAVSAGMRQGQSALAVLLLPLLVPVILAASEATRQSAEGIEAAQWWRWVQLLGACAIVYSVAGWMLFEFVVED